MRRLWHRLFGHPQKLHGHKYVTQAQEGVTVIFLHHCSCESCCDLMTAPITPDSV